MRDLPPGAVNFRHQQRKKLHGPILGTIAAQVWIRQDDGSLVRYDVATWKAWFKQRFGVIGSTEDMSDEAFERFVWAVETFAVTYMAIKFSEE